MKKGTYITVQEFMRTELNLKGNELLVYALIFGFCQDRETKFTGSLKYIANWIGSSKSTAQSVVKKLMEKDLIEKIEYIKNSIKFCEYSILERYTENRYGGIPKTGTGGIPKTGTNNNIDNINNNIDNTIIVKNWKNDFNTYLKELDDAYNELLNNKNWILLQQKYNPGIDIKLTLEKAYVNFWSTEAGWKNKKKKKIENINWKSTLTNSLSQSINRVYIKNNEQLGSQEKNSLEGYEYNRS